MKKYIKFLILALISLSCTEKIKPSQDLFGEYDGKSSGFDYTPQPIGTGNCYGGKLTLHDKGNNRIYIFAGCNGNNPSVLPRFDNLVIAKTKVDSVEAIRYPNAPILYKNILFGIFNQTTKKQVGYILYNKINTATNPPHSYIQEYYVYIPFIVSSNTNDTLTYYFGRRTLKEVLE